MGPLPGMLATDSDIDARRVVVTGMGLITPIGHSLDDFWGSLLDGRSGISRITRFDPSPYPCKVAGEIRDFPASEFFDEKQRKKLALRTQFGVAAALKCLEDAEWPAGGDEGELGVVGGTTNSAVDVIEHAFAVFAERGFKGTRAMPYTLNKVFPHSIASETAARTGFDAKILTVATACTSGFSAIRTGMHAVLRGECEAVLCVAAESELSEYTFGYYCRAGMLAKDTELPPERISRPFDADRSGGVMGEGAGCVLLESLDRARRRGAPVHAELLGVGITGKGYSGAAAEAVPVGFATAIREALAESGCGPHSIDFIGAHGVSDPALDKWETEGLKAALGSYAYSVPVSSIKALTGIPQSAAGMMQFVATVLAMRHDIVPPTMNYETPDPDCDLDYVPNTPRRNRVRRALVYAHGLNASDAAAVLQRPPST